VLKRICQSRKLSELKSDGARLLYTWLILNVDVNGCFSGDPEVIKGQIFTRLKKSLKVIAGYLENLQEVGLVILYESNGDTFLQIPDFVDKQPRINPSKEAKPTIPLPTPDLLPTNSRQTPPKVKESKVKVKQSKGEEESKQLFLDFVYLTIPEHDKLVEKFGQVRTTSLIEELNTGIGSKGYKYKSHYFTILSWARKNEKEPAASKTKLFPLQGKICCKCDMPAVYKDTSGSFDHHYCADHMPERVQEKYR